MSVKVKVAYCTQCNGYYSSTPAEIGHSNHPDIIDHFFYHGEPWFTLDHQTFAKYKSYENIEIRVVKLADHVKNDHVYCRCSKKKSVQRIAYQQESKELKINIESVEKYQIDTDIYFRDLYYTSKNFHGKTYHGIKGNETRMSI
ncbi:hypothetical protein [Chryseobacterium carnipullorum]|uniref:hypothetical protein n=1 Tax=Chryseobacterium carnipullorum TaxID=1124835 RepID=UPI00091CA531|nr:hypothetical protein [Chryseobacterium carnipullorum]SHL75883.1 hypothetical protein SAMN05444360_10488 [Chryseobacterium carnipullorum]HBV14384.1 hypothetical protein [Chryseobacterium carnipullorum]